MTGLFMRFQGFQPMHRINQRHDAIQPEARGQRRMRRQRLQHRHRIGKAGGLDHHALQRIRAPVRQALIKPEKRVHQRPAHGAAQTSIGEFDDTVGRFFHQQVIDADCAEFIDDHGSIGKSRIAQQPVDQGRLAGPEKAGDQRERYFCGHRLSHPAPFRPWRS